jgi:hypothetical protein
MDHEFSDEFMDYVREEERLLEAGDFDAAVELNLSFWCPSMERPEATAALVRGFLEGKEDL